MSIRLHAWASPYINLAQCCYPTFKPFFIVYIVGLNIDSFSLGCSITKKQSLFNMEAKASSGIQLPPGFRFHPSDEELIVHYLKNRVSSSPLPASIIAEIDLYKYNPWELPSLYILRFYWFHFSYMHLLYSNCLLTDTFSFKIEKALFGVDEWYFFTPRDRKYPNGARPNRAAASGYWKATGTDKSIFNSFGTAKIGVKKTLVFYEGRPPKRTKDRLEHAWIQIARCHDLEQFQEKRIYEGKWKGRTHV